MTKAFAHQSVTKWAGQSAVPLETSRPSRPIGQVKRARARQDNNWSLHYVISIIISFLELECDIPLIHSLTWSSCWPVVQSCVTDNLGQPVSNKHAKRAHTSDATQPASELWLACHWFCKSRCNRLEKNEKWEVTQPSTGCLSTPTYNTNKLIGGAVCLNGRELTATTTAATRSPALLCSMFAGLVGHRYNCTWCQIINPIVCLNRCHIGPTKCCLRCLQVVQSTVAFCRVRIERNSWWKNLHDHSGLLG